jgi:hypothetical protein
MGSLAIGSWLIAIAFAFRFLTSALREHGLSQKGPMIVWCGVFLLVTLQLTTSLRPILGTSDQLLTSEKKFFLQHWSETFTDTLPRTDASTADASPGE